MRVEVAGRLVGEDQRRVGDERARDRDPLLLTAGELDGRWCARSVSPTDSSAASPARVPLVRAGGPRR